MYYNKKTKLPNYHKKRLTFKFFDKNINTDENEYLLDEGNGKISYNLVYKNGLLKENWGVKEIKLPKVQANSTNYTKRYTYTNEYTFKKVWRYKYYSSINNRYEYFLLFYASDNKIYYNNIFSYNYVLHQLGNFTFTQTPTALCFRVNGDDVVAFCSPADNMVVWQCDEVPYQLDTAPKFKSICLHNNRLFAIDNNREHIIRYSSVLNPLNWTSSDSEDGAGVIELNDYKGELQNLVSFLNYVYVFRDFGISKIATYSSNNKFSISNIYNSSAKIYCSTICECDGYIFFLAEDGLYKFDGYSVDKIELSILKLMEKCSQYSANSCFFDGKLYLACCLYYGDEQTIPTTNNTVIEYDVSTKKMNLIRGINVSCMYALKDIKMSKLVICLNDATNGLKVWEKCEGIESELTLNKNWESGKITFGEFDSNKILKEIILMSNANCEMIVSTEKESKTISISSSNQMQRIRINMVGKFFSIKFNSSNSVFSLSNPQLIFSMV